MECCIVLSRLVAAAALSGLTACPLTAAADDGTPSRVIAVPNAPVLLTRCSFRLDNYDERSVYSENVVNRTTHPLTSLTVRFQFFDEEGAIGEEQVRQTPSDDGLLASGDTASYTQVYAGKRWSDPSSVLRYTTCRIESATFTRGRAWSYGQTYSGKLIPYSPDQSSAVFDSNGRPSGRNYSGKAASDASPSISIAMEQAWVTHVPDAGSFVHVRVKLTAPAAIDVSPSDFQMNFTLVNGASKNYSPLEQPAPRVLRGGLLSSTGDPNDFTPSVAAAEDFGAIGKITLQPKIAVTMVLTYQVGLLGAAGTVNKIVFRSTT
jgi:hypothetical protein